MEVVSALERAGRELQRAEVTFQLPAVRSATTQVRTAGRQGFVG